MECTGGGYTRGRKTARRRLSRVAGISDATIDADPMQWFIRVSCQDLGGTQTIGDR
ncbi:hypothetical protein GCM10009617_26800 [Leifsonia poae]|uniref:Uncharacterized protein n=1 Tax=Leifsonia poae TaxID=110933 RepID=A0A9W6M0Q0_9MICO|nr:hypothetical protein GCM10017584_27040 [Leifsonia poae]